MNIKNYEEIIKKEIEDALGTDYTVEIKEVNKNNGVNKTGVMIKHSDYDIAPVVYLDDLADVCKDINEIVENVIDCYRRNVFNLDLDIGQSLMSFETIRNEIFVKLINANTNKLMLKDMPHHIIFGDLAVAYYTQVSINGTTGIITINNSLMEMWSVTEEELYSIAMNNIFEKARPTAKPLVNFLSEYLDEEDVESLRDDLALIVCSYENVGYGASIILVDGFLKGLAETIGSDLYILPSSIHEVIVIEKSSKHDLGYLKDMVKSVNETEVSETDFLSNYVFLYSRETDSIAVA